MTGGTTLRRILSYDTRGRLTAIHDMDVPTSAEVARFEVGFDKASNPLFEKYTHRITNGYTEGRIYTNDPLGRLKLVEEGTLVDDPATGLPTIETLQEDWQYALDGLGNWAEHRKGGVTRRTTADGMNFYTAVDRSFDGTAWDGGKPVTRDILGNRLRETRDSFDIVYSHDAFGRLVAIDREDLGGGTLPVATFLYDALNRRVERDIAGAKQSTWVYNGWRIVDEAEHSTATSGPDQLQARNYFGIGLDEIVVSHRQVSGSFTALLPVTDLRGSTERLLDASGSLVESYRYTPYGRRTVHDCGIGTCEVSDYGYDFGFTGHQVESFIAVNRQLAYARNREYDPEQGRFLQRDPIGAAGGPNIYEYTRSRPVLYMDPLGLFGVELGGSPDALNNARTADEAARLGVRLVPGWDGSQAELGQLWRWNVANGILDSRERTLDERSRQLNLLALIQEARREARQGDNASALSRTGGDCRPGWDCVEVVVESLVSSQIERERAQIEAQRRQLDQQREQLLRAERSRDIATVLDALAFTIDVFAVLKTVASTIGGAVGGSVAGPQGTVIGGMLGFGASEFTNQGLLLAGNIISATGAGFSIIADVQDGSLSPMDGRVPPGTLNAASLAGAGFVPPAANISGVSLVLSGTALLNDFGITSLPFSSSPSVSPSPPPSP